jgi:AraC-like DNA-binding protein
MKPQLLKISSGPAISFTARQIDHPYLNSSWHYHPEIELLHVIEGEGTLLVGDAIMQFKAGDVLLIGAHLPHYWRFYENYIGNNALPAQVAYVQFCDNFWGKDFLLLPENNAIKLLLDKAKRGMYIQGATAAKTIQWLSKLIVSEQTERIIVLLQLLHLLAASTEFSLLSSVYQEQHFEAIENERINVVYKYLLTHFKNKIYLHQVAAIANLTPNSFCRFFKAKTKKSFSLFLIEIRVGYACKLLLENNLSIKQICYASGFNSFTNFNKQFKSVTGKLPSSYQKQVAH